MDSVNIRYNISMQLVSIQSLEDKVDIISTYLNIIEEFAKYQIILNQNCFQFSLELPNPVGMEDNMYDWMINFSLC